MNITQLRKHIDEIKWDDDFSPFYEKAATGNPNAVFDLFILNYLDHDCRLRGIDFELLTYCTDNNHSVAEHFMSSICTEIDKNNGWQMILSYYESMAQNENPLKIWLLGLCYESFGFEYSKSIESENAYGRKCMVMAFECYKRCADMDFPLGVQSTIYYIENPDAYGIAFIKDEATLNYIYALKAKDLDLDKDLVSDRFQV